MASPHVGVDSGQDDLRSVRVVLQASRLPRAFCDVGGMAALIMHLEVIVGAVGKSFERPGGTGKPGDELLGRGAGGLVEMDVNMSSSLN